MFSNSKYIKALLLLFFLTACGSDNDANNTSPTTIKGKLVLTFDDHYYKDWVAALPIFERYNAKVTFFLSRYEDFLHCATCQHIRNDLNAILMSGHSVEFHGLHHVDAVNYVRDLGLSSYLDYEVIPGLELMHSDGLNVSTMAMPFGSTNSTINLALLAHVHKVRGFIGGNGNSANVINGLNQSISNGRSAYIPSQSIDRPYFMLDAIMDAMDKAQKNGQFLVLTSHRIMPTCDTAYCISQHNLESVLDYAQSIGMDFATFDELP